MLNIGGLQEGVVIDHIKAGGSMEIYHYLELEKLDCSVAIIKNAKSSKMGKKDIIKIDDGLLRRRYPAHPETGQDVRQEKDGHRRLAHRLCS